ncbi:MAG: hypothetical protein RIR33_1677 [Pseudomonadota bacterium]|jgi:hypothetical protein
MIDRALSGLFKVVTEEAAVNPAFGKKLEDALAKFGQELADKRLAERKIDNFHPLVEFRKDAAAFEVRLAKFDAKELRALIERHHLDPAAMLKGKGTKKVLAAHILEAARKRAERDGKLFEY